MTASCVKELQKGDEVNAYTVDGKTVQVNCPFCPRGYGIITIIGGIPPVRFNKDTGTISIGDHGERRFTGIVERVVEVRDCNKIK